MFKVLVEGCEPKRATKYSAAIDLFAAEDVVIGAGETVKVPLGVCVDENKLREIIARKSIYSLAYDKNSSVWGRVYDEFYKAHYLQLEPRSSLRAKGLQAGTGIIDLDYKDEICIILHNGIQMEESIDSEGKRMVFYNNEYKISKGDKIAQIMLCEHKSYLMGYESEEERSGGFGSTGDK